MDRWGTHTWWGAHIHGGEPTYMVGARGAPLPRGPHHVCGLPTMYGFPTMYQVSRYPVSLSKLID